MEKAQLLGLLSALPDETDLADVEELVVGKYHNLPGDVLAVIMQGPSTPSAPVAAKKRGRPAKANGAAAAKKNTGGLKDEKVLSQIKRRKNGIAMGDLATKFPDNSTQQIRAALKRLGKQVKTTGNKRSTLYHAK